LFIGGGAVLAALVAAGLLLRKPPPGQAPPSIAVLPFLNLSSDKEQEYFSDGLSEELLNLLARVPGLQVAARTSAFAFKGQNEDVRSIAEKLHVATILEGSVRRAGDQIRITTQLINAANGYHLWSETYDRKLTDVFAVQDEIASAVVAALKLKLLAAPVAKGRRTANSQAYDQYLLGRQLFFHNNVSDFHRSMEAFQKAVALDPGFAAAWAGLAQATYWVADSGSVAAEILATQDRALKAGETAVALGPDIAQAYAARGFVRGSVFDWAGARADFERALQLDPNDVDALRDYALIVLRPTGRLEEGLTYLRKAAEVDPLNSRAWTSVGSFLVALGRLKEGREVLNRAYQLNPESQFIGIALCTGLLLEGQPEAALSAGLRSPAGHNAFRLECAAIANHQLGRSGEAQKALDELISNWSDGAAYQIAAVYAWEGDKDRAFQWLDRAYRQRDGGLTHVKADPILASLRGDPRYAALLRKMGLPAD
jgi:TolB-like protein